MGRLPHSEPASRRDQIVQAAMTHAGVGAPGRPPLSRPLRRGAPAGAVCQVLAQIWQEPSPGRLSDLAAATTAAARQAHLGPRSQVPASSCSPWPALAARNTAVLVVLHDLNLAARYADRLVMLERGRADGGRLPGRGACPGAHRPALRPPAQVIHHPETGQPMVV